MKFALFIIIVNASAHEAPGENSDMWWAIAGNMTLEECQTKAKVYEPHRIAMFGAATGTRLACAEDHAANEW